MKKVLIICMALVCLCLISCKEHFSDGERVGTVTKFSEAGVVWDSWDGHLNITQTGMNSAGEPFAFSLDNDRTDQTAIVNQLLDAQRYGWKVKVCYHQVWGFKNLCNNRGETKYFVDSIEVLDKNFAHPFNNGTALKGAKDTMILGSKENPVHVVIDK